MFSSPHSLIGPLLALVLCLGITSVHGETAYLTYNQAFSVFRGNCTACTADSPCAVPISTTGSLLEINLSSSCTNVVYLAGDYPYTQVLFAMYQVTGGTTFSSLGAVNFLHSQAYDGTAVLGFYGEVRFENFTAAGFFPYIVSYNTHIHFTSCNITFATGARVASNNAMTVFVEKNTYLKFVDAFTMDTDQTGAGITLTIDSSILEADSGAGYIEWNTNLGDSVSITNSYIRNVRFFRSGPFFVNNSIITSEASIGLLMSTAANSDFTVLNSIINGSDNALPPLTVIPIGNILLKNVSWTRNTPLYPLDGNSQVSMNSVTLDEVNVVMNSGWPFIGINAISPPSTMVSLTVTRSSFTNTQSSNSFGTFYVDLDWSQSLNLELSTTTYSGSGSGMYLPENVNITAPSRFGRFRMLSTNGTTIIGSDLELFDVVSASYSGVSLALNNSRATLESNFSSSNAVVVSSDTTLVYRPTSSAGIDSGLSVSALVASTFSLDLSIVQPTPYEYFPLAPAPYEILYHNLTTTWPRASDVNTTYANGVSKYYVTAAPVDPNPPSPPPPTGESSILSVSLCSVIGSVVASLILLY